MGGRLSAPDRPAQHKRCSSADHASARPYSGTTFSDDDSSTRTFSGKRRPSDTIAANDVLSKGKRPHSQKDNLSSSGEQFDEFLALEHTTRFSRAELRILYCHFASRASQLQGMSMSELQRLWPMFPAIVIETLLLNRKDTHTNRVDFEAAMGILSIIDRGTPEERAQLAFDFFSQGKEVIEKKGLKTVMEALREIKPIPQGWFPEPVAIPGLVFPPPVPMNFSELLFGDSAEGEQKTCDGLTFEQFKQKLDILPGMLTLFGVFEFMRASVLRPLRLVESGIYERQGYLLLKGNNPLNLWKERWVAIQGGCMFLYYLKAAADVGEPAYKTLVLDDCLVRVVDVKKYIFKLNIHSHTYTFRADSYSDMQLWVAILLQYTYEATGNPFNCFAPLRDGINVKWHICGKDSFAAIADAIENARTEVMISSRIISPYIYLKRPAVLGFEPKGEHPETPRDNITTTSTTTATTATIDYPSYRLDRLLKRKAVEGVKIYILLPAGLKRLGTIEAGYYFADLHRNINVVCAKPAIASNQTIVISDQDLAIIGGLELAFGRWDDKNFSLTDECHLRMAWPGKDYLNIRVEQPVYSVEPYAETIDRTKYPRMPWHSVMLSVDGASAGDVSSNFIQRWNHNRAFNSLSRTGEVPFLTTKRRLSDLFIPRDSKETPPSAAAEEKKEKIWNYWLHQHPLHDTTPAQYTEALVTAGLEKVNELRAKIPQHMRGSKHVSGEGHEVEGEERKSERGGEQKQGDTKKEKEKGKEKKLHHHHLHLPKKVGFADSSSKRHKHIWERKEGIRRMTPRRSGLLENGMTCQIVRTISAPTGASQKDTSLYGAILNAIEISEHYVYIENQSFTSSLGNTKISNKVGDLLIQRIRKAILNKSKFKVILVLPVHGLPVFQTSMTMTQYRIYRGVYDLFDRIVKEFPTRALAQHICICCLRKYGYVGNRLRYEQIQITSSVVIVDDRVAIVSSAEINDNSLLGPGCDIGAVVTGGDLTRSLMDGKPYEVSKPVQTLRMQLWAIHLGLECSQLQTILDPIADSVFEEMWLRTAAVNTSAFKGVFPRLLEDDELPLQPKFMLRLTSTNPVLIDQLRQSARRTGKELEAEYVGLEELNGEEEGDEAAGVAKAAKEERDEEEVGGDDEISSDSELTSSDPARDAEKRQKKAQERETLLNSIKGSLTFYPFPSLV